MASFLPIMKFQVDSVFYWKACVQNLMIVFPNAVVKGDFFMCSLLKLK